MELAEGGTLNNYLFKSDKPIGESIVSIVGLMFMNRMVSKINLDFATDQSN